MSIRHKNRKFYVEVFFPEHRWKYQGKIARFKNIDVFVTHIKIPSKHFYIKEQGYPLNTELLDALHNAHIQYILIPEQGKTGFRAYIGETNKYRHGIEIKEPKTEAQKVIPLRELKLSSLTKEELYYD